MKRKKENINHLYHSNIVYVCIHSCVRLCNPLNCSPPGSSVHGIFQKEYWLPVPPPGSLSDPGIEPASLISPALAGRFFTLCHLGRHLFRYLPLLIFILYPGIITLYPRKVYLLFLLVKCEA